MEKTRIAFVIDSLAIGGSEGHLLSLIRGLNRARFEPYLVCLVASDGLKTPQLDCQMRVLEVRRLRSFHALVQLVKLARFLRKERIDVVQTFFVEGSIVGVISAALGGVPIVICARRDLGFWYTPALRLTFRLLNLWIDHYMVNCEAVGRVLVQEERVDRAKVVVIPNGIDLQAIGSAGKDRGEELRRAVGLRSIDRVVGVVANLNRPVKRVDLFLEAAAEVLRSRSDAVFVIVGDGHLKSQLNHLATRLGIADSVRWLGQQEDVIPFLKMLDIGVLCSDSEGSPNAILEYMAAGVPTVATGIGGVVELIQQGVNGLLVTPGQPRELARAIEMLLDDAGLYKRCQEGALKSVKRFTREAMVDRHESFYAFVAGRP